MLLMGFLDIKNTKSVNTQQAIIDSIRNVISSNYLITPFATICEILAAISSGWSINNCP